MMYLKSIFYICLISTPFFSTCMIRNTKIEKSDHGTLYSGDINGAQLSCFKEHNGNTTCDYVIKVLMYDIRHPFIYDVKHRLMPHLAQELIKKCEERK